MTYSVIGLGKLGASMAAAIAARGFQVIGVDVDPRAVDLVNAGHAPVRETRLEETIAANRERLRATTRCAEAVAESDLSFVIVPTPSEADGAFSLRFAKRAFGEIGRALAGKDGYHVVVLTSTVLPGSCRFGLLPVLERESGKTCGNDFGLCYSPEFIALGSVIHDFLNPDFTLIGEFDERCGRRLEESYARIMENGPPCRRMSLENAELAKVALNTFVTTKIAYANMLAELCAGLPGGDVDAVTGALGLDRRIGPRYLTGGMGYGGPCFPRDNVALGWFARRIGCDAGLARTTDAMNRAWCGQLVRTLRSALTPGSTVTILGLAYKPFSHVIEESQGVRLARELAAAGFRVIGYDPQAGVTARPELAGAAVVVEDLRSGLEAAEAVVITTPDPEFRGLRPEHFPARTPPVAIFDCWRLLRATMFAAGHVRYLPLGIGAPGGDNGARLRALWEDLPAARPEAPGRVPAELGASAVPALAAAGPAALRPRTTIDH